MEPWSAKVFAMVSLFAVVLVFGLLPVRLLGIIRRSRTPESNHGMRSPGQMVIDGLNCFGGGVFLATSLLNMLPEVRKDIESILEMKHQKISFPLAEFIACMGFFVVMIIEHLLIQCHRKQSSGPEDPDVEQETRSILPSLNVSPKNGYGTVALANGGITGKSVDMFPKVKVTSLPDDDLNENCRISVSSDTDLTAHTSSKSHSDMHDDDNHHYSDVHTLRSLVLLLALSTHTIFEGLALGLQSTVQQVLTLLVAVLIHKAVISFTVGIRFAESMHSFRRTALALVLLSIMAPVGVAIGILVTETGQHNMATDVASAVLQGMATGTFLYVTFFEVLLEQMKDNHNILKVLCVIVGFGCITLLDVFTAEGH